MFTNLLNKVSHKPLSSSNSFGEKVTNMSKSPKNVVLFVIMVKLNVNSFL